MAGRPEPIRVSSGDPTNAVRGWSTGVDVSCDVWGTCYHSQLTTSPLMAPPRMAAMGSERRRVSKTWRPPPRGLALEETMRWA